MRALLLTCWFAAPAPAFADDPPAKKDDPPHAVLKFSRDRTLKEWASTFELTTAGGKVYELRIHYGARGNMYDTDTLKAMLGANWVAEPTDDGGLRVYGARTKDGRADAVKKLTVTNRLVRGEGRMPDLTPGGTAEVENRTDDGKGELAPARKPRPTGPDIGKESYVEFDLTTLPPGTTCVFWELIWEVRTTAGEEEPWIRIPMEVNSDDAAGNATAFIDGTFAECGFKAEVIDKTKVRVYGGVRGDRFYPAVRGTVESKHLKPGQLPKVTNPPRT